MKKVICEKDVDALTARGETTLYVDARTILTPSARDAVKAAGIEVVEGRPACSAPEAVTGTEPPAACQAACQADEISSDTIYKALSAMLDKGMLDKGMLEGLVDAAAGPAQPYTAETHDSGLKLVRGNTVKMESLGVPGANACYREMVGKGEATTSSGFLEIENSRFDWELEYEETDYVIEGTMTVSVGGREFTARAGDMFFLPKGSKVVMGSPDRCRVFYTTYPAL